MPKTAVITHPVHQGSERARLGSVMSFTPAVSCAHQAGAFEDAQMFRHRRLRNPRVVGQHSNRLFTITAQTLEECAAGRVSKRFEEGIGRSLHKMYSSLVMEQSIAIWLWIVKNKIEGCQREARRKSGGKSARLPGAIRADMEREDWREGDGPPLGYFPG